REHLAAVKVADAALVLTTMRFAHEIVPATELNVPRGDAGLDRREVDLALQLVDTLTADWQPDKYRDRYREALLAAIQRKVEGRAIAAPAAARKPPTKVVDLMQALQASLEARAPRTAGKVGRKPAAPAGRPAGAAELGADAPDPHRARRARLLRARDRRRPGVTALPLEPGRHLRASVVLHRRRARPARSAAVRPRSDRDRVPGGAQRGAAPA